MANRNQDYISILRQEAKALWDAVNTLEGLQKEWTALDYSATLEAGEGENIKQGRADIGAVVFDTTNAIRALLDGGHATNLAKLL